MVSTLVKVKAVRQSCFKKSSCELEPETLAGLQHVMGDCLYRAGYMSVYTSCCSSCRAVCSAGGRLGKTVGKSREG